MKRLENFAENANEMLGGLHASEELKKEILLTGTAIRRGESVPARSTPWAKPHMQGRKARACIARRAAALCCALAVVVGVLAGMPALLASSKEPVSLITTQQGGIVEANLQALDVPQGSIAISNRDKPAYRGVWAAASGGNFPLVCVEGRYYRLMSNPTAIGSDLLGAAIGTVDTYTGEPALYSSGVFSNVVAQGETVYAVQGMSGALAAAKVDGTMRVFQRVSFGANALKGGEGLGSTLCAGSVVAMELTGVGTVTDSATAQQLYNTLLQNATLIRAGASETGESLLIQLANGIVLQMAVRDESVMACGTWTCPEFFEAFQRAVQ